MSKLYLGIDPGANGGISLLYDNEVTCTPMPHNDPEIWGMISKAADWAKDIVLPHEEIFCVIEQQTPRPTGYTDRKTGKFISTILASTCELYGNYKLLVGMLIAARIPFEEVPPKRWQEGLKIPKKVKGESSTQWKNKLKEKAMKLFPTIKVTLAVSDSLLLAEYCRRMRIGTL